MDFRYNMMIISNLGLLRVMSAKRFDMLTYATGRPDLRHHYFGHYYLSLYNGWSIPMMRDELFTLMKHLNNIQRKVTACIHKRHQ